MIADGLGTSVDETVAEFMLFFAAGLAIAGYRTLRRTAFVGRPRWLGAVFLVLAVSTTAAAFTVPQRYLRPRPSKIRPSTTARFEIVSPKPDAVVSRTLPVRFSLEGARLITTATTRLSPREGHIHVSIDGKLLGMTYGLSDRIDVSGLSPGDHLLKAEFVAGDHAPFSPRVARSVRFQVRRG